MGKDNAQPIAYLVVGPESSGTRFLTGLLLKWGCEGSDKVAQFWDCYPPKASEHGRIVWRRSFPHGEAWPDLRALADQLRATGYEVRAAVITRDWCPMLQSQVRVGHVELAEVGLAEQQEAYPLIFGQLASAKVPFLVTSYEALVHNPHAIRMLAEMLGLGRQPMVVPRNENAKYYPNYNPLPSLADLK